MPLFSSAVSVLPEGFFLVALRIFFSFNYSLCYSRSMDCSWRYSLFLSFLLPVLYVCPSCCFWVTSSHLSAHTPWVLYHVILFLFLFKIASTCTCVLFLQLYPTICHPMDCSPWGSSVQVIFQARILEWVAISSPGDLSDPGLEPMSSALIDGFFITEPPEKPIISK